MFKASVSKVMGVAATAVGLMMAASSASAVTVENLNPFTLDGSSTFAFNAGTVLQPGDFTNYYAFQVSDPIGQITSDFNYTTGTQGFISPFTATLFNAQNCSIPVGRASGTCDLGGSVANFTYVAPNQVSLDWTGVTAGYYVIEISGTNTTNGPLGLSGQVVGREAPVPLPGTVALLGLGLSGLAAARRRKA